MDGWEEGRRNRNIGGARIFAGVKRTGCEERDPVDVKEILAKIERGEEGWQFGEPVSARDLLDKIKRDKDVKLKYKIIKGDLDLTQLDPSSDADNKLIVTSSIDIRDCYVMGYVNFDRVEFKNSVRFFRTVFGKKVNFCHAHFFGISDFMGSCFGGENPVEPWDQCSADFSHVQFDEHAEFDQAQFDRTACFKDAQFKVANFRCAYFRKNADFRRANFSKDVNFNYVQFVGDANFEEAKFTGDSRFYDAHFDKNLILTRTTIDKMALNNSQFKKESEILLKHAILNKLYIRWDEINPHLKYRYDDEYDWATYSALVKNFRDLVRYDDADDCYYEFRKKHQDAKSWLRENRRGISRFNWSKLYDHIAWRSCGYGVRPGFTLAWIIGTILGFASLHRILEGIASSVPTEISIELFNNSTSLFILEPVDANGPTLWECIYFSAMSLTGNTPEGLHPIGAWKYAVMIESVLGYLFLALFIVVLARKFIR